MRKLFTAGLLALSGAAIALGHEVAAVRLSLPARTAIAAADRAVAAVKARYQRRVRLIRLHEVLKLRAAERIRFFSDCMLKCSAT